MRKKPYKRNGNILAIEMLHCHIAVMEGVMEEAEVDQHEGGH